MTPTLRFRIGEYVVITLDDGRKFSGVVWYGTTPKELCLNSGSAQPHKWDTSRIVQVSRPIRSINV